MQLRCVRKHFGQKRRTDLERRRTGFFLQLSNFVGCGVGILAYGNFNKFRRAGGKDPAKGEFCRLRRRNDARGATDKQHGERNEEFEPGNHRKGEMRGEVTCVAPSERAIPAREAVLREESRPKRRRRSSACR